MLHFAEHWLPYVAQRPRLLIVDDQPTNIHALREIFREHCDVLMATNGEQALSLCQNQLPDLVLLDVVMEGMNGHEVCRRLKANPQTSGIPVIFITAQHQEMDEILGLELGAVDFISKPINPTIVRARVRTHLALKLQSDMLRSIAMLDGLTGVANRRRFDEYLDINWRQAARDKTQLSLIMIDVDYFKRYNDHYGHLAGDNCLRIIAKALAEFVRRPMDLVARYGGEEFACVLPNTSLQGAYRLAETMRKSIEALSIEHKLSDVAPCVSASFGVASTAPDSESNAMSLVAAADQQLYMAKGRGRNQVSADDALVAAT